MGSAISIGTTGLTASSKQMDVIGNNLANSNTLGFKAGTTSFASMLNQSLSGSGAMSVGQGVAVSSISTQFAQGSFENTANATDMAIDGNGFFIVKDGEGALYYTRAGSFHINKEGYLVDSTDYKVQGYNLFSSSNTVGTDDDDVQLANNISLANVQSTARATTDISVGANLNEDESYGGKFNVTQTVFDSKGAMHSLSLTFQKTEIAGMWGFDAKLDGNLSLTTAQSACGIIFDSDGALLNLYKGDITNVSEWGEGTVAAATAVVAGDGTIGGTAINNPEELSRGATGIVLTKSLAGDGAWTVAGYAGATATQTGLSLTVDLDSNTGTGADITFTLADTWAVGDQVTFDVANAGTSGVISGTTISKPGQLYKDTTVATGPITLTKGAATGVWSVTTNGGYTNALAWQEKIDGVEYLKVDLDGKGGSDIIFNLGATAGNLWTANDTVRFDVDKTDVASQDLALTFGDLGNGATIGESTGSLAGGDLENKITWNLTGDDAHEITGYASTSVVKSLYSDGYSSGVLKGLSIGSDGIISGFFTNGQTSNLAQIVLADFPNISGLKKVGNYFGMTNDSGEAITNAPGSRGLGEILSNSLELSNTDVAKEFVNMITAQRAYQASAKVITTADQMLSELMNIKR
ncbi:MAG: flagellar hook-basal body complex protein [Pseudomonadota bacterium]